MGGFDNTYSCAVAVAKIVLPLIALGILSSLFLISRPAQQGEPIASADMDVQDLAREQRLGAPTYRGVTNEGTQVALSADELRPDPQRPELVHGSILGADILTASGFGYTVRAESGTIDRERNLTTLDDGVRIETSNGYVITTNVATIQTDSSQLDTPGPVEASGPLGQLRAGSLRMTGDVETGENVVVVFKDGVQLLYTPDT